MILMPALAAPAGSPDKPDGGVASVKEGSDSRSHSTSSMRLFSGLEGEMVKKDFRGPVLGCDSHCC